MAHDKTPARSNTILFYTVLTVVTLGMLYPLFNTYFNDMVEAEVYDKQLSYESPEMQEARQQQTEALSGAAMPIDQAMGQLAQRGRRGVPVVTPEQSEDVGAIEGWALHKNTAAAEEAREAWERVHAPPPPPPPVVVPDGGLPDGGDEAAVTP